MKSQWKHFSKTIFPDCLIYKSDLDRPRTSEEIMGVIKGLPRGKAPGPDGFTAEFFKCYVSELTPLLLSIA